MTSKDHWLDAHKNGTPWTISKAFDTSTPVGKFIEKSQIPEQEIADYSVIKNNFDSGFPVPKDLTLFDFSIC
jgi:hypothetical protein